MLLGLLGVVVLAWNKASFSSGGSGWAILACLGATLSYGVAANFTKRFLSGCRRSPSPPAASFSRRSC